MLINIILGAAFAALLLYTAVVDVKKLDISDVVNVIICALAVVKVLIGGISPLSAFLGLLIAGLPLLFIRLVKSGSVGGGDIKLSAAAGFFLGLEGAVFMMMVYCILFLCTSALLRVIGKLEPGTPSAFSPFIAAGGIITYTLILLGG